MFLLQLRVFTNIKKMQKQFKTTLKVKEIISIATLQTAFHWLLVKTVFLSANMVSYDNVLEDGM